MPRDPKKVGNTDQELFEEVGHLMGILLKIADIVHDISNVVDVSSFFLCAGRGYSACRGRSRGPCECEGGGRPSATRQGVSPPLEG